MKLKIFIKDQYIIQAQILKENEKTIILPKDIEISNVRLWSSGKHSESVNNKQFEIFLKDLTEEAKSRFIEMFKEEINNSQDLFEDNPIALIVTDDI